MGAFLSQIMDKLLGGEREAHTEVDHNICLLCGTVNIVEQDSSDDEKPCVKERSNGNKNIVH
jgi:hypothetical protein